MEVRKMNTITEPRATEDVIETIPEEHTVAIIVDNTLYYSGMMADARLKWDNLPFDAPHGIYSYVMKTIENKWYRLTWMQF